MFAGELVVLIRGFQLNGGVLEVFRKAAEGGRFEFLKWAAVSMGTLHVQYRAPCAKFCTTNVVRSFTPNPTTRHTVWSVVIGGAFTWTAIYAVNQAMVQRALSCPTLKRAQMFALFNFNLRIAHCSIQDIR